MTSKTCANCGKTKEEGHWNYTDGTSLCKEGYECGGKFKQENDKKKRI